MKSLNFILILALVITFLYRANAEPIMRFDERYNKSANDNSAPPQRPAYFDSYKKSQPKQPSQPSMSTSSSDPIGGGTQQMPPSPASPSGSDSTATNQSQGPTPEQMQALESAKKQMEAAGVMNPTMYNIPLPASVPPQNK